MRGDLPAEKAEKASDADDALFVSPISVFYSQKMLFGRMKDPGRR